jgi:hypothetical protein
VKDHDSKKERASAQEKPRKRMLESSSDCSFLERGLSSDPRPETLDTHSVIRGTKIQERPKSRHQRLEVERSVSLEESGDSLSITPRVELFEKRKRHKTRGDRYEPRQELVDPKPQVNRERKREKKRKTKSRGKGLRNAGEDLMRQFSSKSVGRDRLTVCANRPVQYADLLRLIRCAPRIPLAYSKTVEHRLLEGDGDVGNRHLALVVLLTSSP